MLKPISDPRIAIRTNGLGCEFGRGFDFRGASPSEGGRVLLAALGFRIKPSSDVQTAAFINGLALKDISLEIEKGSIVCLIGATDSGKTTLLKILAGVIAPSEGSAELRGVVSSLLDVGDNVDGTLSALENVEVQRRLKKIPDTGANEYVRDIIEFAGLSGFESSLVRTYSSGMTMRLSVALALQGDPDILLMDDVLGVGDLAFQQKLVGRLLELKAAGCTMVFAMNDEDLVHKLATRILSFEDGTIVDDEIPSHVICVAYPPATDLSWHISRNLPENDAVAIKSIEAARREYAGRTVLDFEMQFVTKIGPQHCRLVIDVFREGIAVFRSVSLQDVLVVDPSNVRVTVGIPVNLLPRGQYHLMPTIVSSYDQTIYSLKAQGAITVEVRRPDDSSEGASALVRAELPWEVQVLAEGPA